MTPLEFLSAMYGKAASGWLTVWTMPDKRTVYFPKVELHAALAYAENRFDTHDVYYGVGLRRAELGENQRGGNNDVSLIPAFWSDIDVRSAAHKETELPETIEIALEFLDALPLKPSIVADSGNGLHVYWLFTEPLVIMTDAHRKNISDALSGWQRHINAAAKERGWKIDNTSDIARVLRLPGGVNHKLGNGCRCRIIAVNDVQYAPSDFTPYIGLMTAGDVPAPQVSAQSDKFTAVVGESRRVIDKCAFIRYCRDNAAALPEPYWHVMVSNLALCSDGAARCHEFSKPYPAYTAAETDKKIEHALKERKPHTCEHIKSALGFDCGACGAGRKAPAALAVITKADTVRELLETDVEDWSAVFNENYIEALSYAKAKMSADYAKFKMRCKGKLNIVDLERAVKDYTQSLRKQSLSAANAKTLELDGLALDGAVIPPKWNVSEIGGVWRTISTRDGESNTIACPVPVVITRKLENLDDGKQRLVVTFLKNHCWKSVTGKVTQMFNKASLISYADDGLHVTSGTAAELVSYLSDFLSCNTENIPLVSSTSRLGWFDNDTQFFPYAVNKEIVFEEDKGTTGIFNSLTERGDYSVWKEMMRELRKNTVARFITSASFASPLLEKIDVRTFTIHLWHNSGVGKTAALKAALSVWGNPLKLIGSFFTTMVGTEQLAGTLRNLPLGIDEKQAAEERKIQIDTLIYVLSLGKGKVRGARDGGNAEFAEWHNLVIITGEEPITKATSKDGVQARVFEINAPPMTDSKFGKQVHVVSENNYGYAGAAFMRAICGRLKENPGFLNQLYNRMMTELETLGALNLHTDYVASVALGDYLAETIIFGTDGETAMRTAVECGAEIYVMNETQISADAVTRAWEFTQGWLVSNAQRFEQDAAPCYGKVSESSGGKYYEYFVIPQYLDGAIEDEGYNVKKSIQGFAERNWLRTQQDGKKTRTKVMGRVNGQYLRGYSFQLPRDGIMPLNGVKE